VVAADSPFILLDRIEMLATFMPGNHQISFFELFQVMADRCWLTLPLSLFTTSFTLDQAQHKWVMIS
jgi:hypothetical protein